MRAFLNQVANNRVEDSEITKSQIMTEELMGKIEQVNQTSKILKFGD